MRLMKVSVSMLATLAGATLVGCAVPAEDDAGPIAEEGFAAKKPPEPVFYDYNIPNTWVLVNNTTSTLTFSITNAPSLYCNNLSMPPQTVAAGGTLNYKWYGYYNDALGLQACIWNGTTENNGTIYAPFQYETNWGENVRIRAEAAGIIAIDHHLPYIP